jgi:Lon-like protease
VEEPGVESEVVEQESRSSSRWAYTTLSSLALVAVLSVVAWNVEIPYLAYSAGPVSDASNSIRAEGVDIYQPTGELLMLTVIGQNVNIFEAVIAMFDPTIDLIRREAVRAPGETDEEYRSRSLQQMDDSNFRSIVVALRALGYDMVPVEVIVNEIVEGVPAEAVLELGDTIVSVEGVEVSSISDFAPLVRDLPVGAVIQMTVRRGGELLDLEVELAERSDEPGVAMIGLILGEIIEPPFEVGIRTGNVGGPSAGMMHTLAIIDNLTEGELTGGLVIAGTGTINSDGQVGAIGGIRQKVVAAEAAGASYILVPEANYQEALSMKRERIVVVSVLTLADALEFLESLPSS